MYELRLKIYGMNTNLLEQLTFSFIVSITLVLQLLKFNFPTAPFKRSEWKSWMIYMRMFSAYRIWYVYQLCLLKIYFLFFRRNIKGCPCIRNIGNLIMYMQYPFNLQKSSFIPLHNRYNFWQVSTTFCSSIFTILHGKTSNHSYHWMHCKPHIRALPIFNFCGLERI